MSILLVFAAYILFFVVAFIVIKNFLIYFKFFREKQSNKNCFTKKEKITVLLLLFFIYFSLILSSVLSSLNAGNGVLIGLKTGIQIAIANTLRLPCLIILLFLLYLLYQTRTQKSESKNEPEVSSPQGCGTYDGSPSHDENSD